MKIAIIGAGNIGGAIASGLMQSQTSENYSIVISDPDTAKTSQLAQQYAGITAEVDNQKAVADAQIVLLAVKPWLVEKVLANITLQSFVFVSVCKREKLVKSVKCNNSSAASFIFSKSRAKNGLK